MQSFIIQDKVWSTKETAREWEKDSKDAKLFDYISTEYWAEKSTTKDIALVDKKNRLHIVQERQIVKAVGKQIDIKYLLCVKYAITSFQYTAWLLISVIG